MENNNENLKPLNDLISLLTETLDQPDKYFEKIPWHEVLSNVKGIRDGYNTLQKDKDPLADYWLYSVSVGLNMYFSYFDMSWMDDKLSHRINERQSQIVNNAAAQLVNPPPTLHIPTVTQPCGQHEDGACTIAPMSARCISLPNCNILAEDLQNFLPIPRKETIRPGTKLYRVVGPGNLKEGAWWFRDKMPPNKTQWRSRYAVLTDWNKDSDYIEYTVKAHDNINAWVGDAATQHVYWVWVIKIVELTLKVYPNTSCILPGRDEQIWLDEDTRKMIATNLVPKKTGW